MLDYSKYKREREVYNCDVTCMNCGETGHIIKKCKTPITSFGIIIFKVVNNKEEEINDIPDDVNEEFNKLYKAPNHETYPKIKFLMIQRKDTMSYIDFLRAKYPLNEAEKASVLMTQFSEMTEVERQNLLNCSFEQLWDNLWCNKKSRLYKDRFIAEKSFSKSVIKKYIALTKSKWVLNEFGFAKGRRNIRETNLQCAEREFFEETNYTKKTYQILDYPVIKEHFLATNGIVYEHKYFLVKLKKQFNDFYPSYSDLQLTEVKNIGWYTIQQCTNLIRYYDTEKKKMIQNVYENIIKMNNQYKLVEPSIFDPPIYRYF